MFAAADNSIIDFAVSNGMCIVTLDADFHSMVVQRQSTTPSVVRIRIEGLKAPALVEVIQRVLSQCSVALQGGALVSVTESRISFRLLPVKGSIILPGP